MASYSTIYMNYNKAMKQANRLEELANELRGLANNDVDDTLSHLSSQWKGDNANTYVRKGYELQKNLLATAKKMTDTATAIRTAAKRTRASEIAAIELAEKIKNRSVGGGGSSGGGGSTRQF